MLIPCFIVFVAIEMLLGARIWLQLTTAPVDAERTRLIMSLTDTLARPFEAITQRPLLDRTGVVDYTALVAMEGYLLAMLGLVVVVVFLSSILSFLRAHVHFGRKQRRLPDGRLLRRVAVAGRGRSYAFLVGPPAKVEPLIPRDRRPAKGPILRRRAS